MMWSVAYDVFQSWLQYMHASDSLSSTLTAPTSLWRTCLSACCVIVIRAEVYELKVGGRFSKCSLTHLPFPLPWVSLATNYTRYPPKSPHTPPLKFMCHLLITELVNVSPPAPLLLSSQYGAALLCQQFSSSPSSSCSLIISPLFSSAVSFPQLWADDYSNKQRLSLQITTLIQTPVLPLLLSVVVDYCAVLQRLSRAFVCLSQSHDDLVVTLRHALVGDTVAYPGKAKAQLFKSVLLCINSGWEEWLPATVMHSYLNSAIV